VQQLDPDAMIRSILSCGKQWKTFYQRQGNKAPVETPSGGDDQGGRGRAAGTSGGGSGGDRRPSGPKRSNPTSRESDNKRQAGAAASRPGRAANSGGGGAFDPFTRYGNVTADKTDANQRPWVRGMTQAQSMAMRDAKKCLFCEKTGHFADVCPDREGMFRAKKICFHPSK
jgi:hypothetical protein